MSFINSPRFPDDISRGSSGGPQFSTKVVKIASGYESRNQQWSKARRRYNVAYGVKTWAQLNALISFFHEARGMLHSFRFKDHMDYQATAESITVAAGVAQLTKTYGSANPYTRTITAPVSGTVTIYNDATPLVEDTNYTLNYTTGVVTVITGMDGAITWTGEFDVPVRFDTDEISASMDDYNSGGLSVPLIEVRP